MRIASYDHVYQGVYDNTWSGAVRYLWLAVTGRLDETRRRERIAAVRAHVRERRAARERFHRELAAAFGDAAVSLFA